MVLLNSGEVSLPGGKTEEGDRDEKETALREAKEEIGLEPSLVSVVTVLQPFLSKVQLSSIYQSSTKLIIGFSFFFNEIVCSVMASWV